MKNKILQFDLAIMSSKMLTLCNSVSKKVYSLADVPFSKQKSLFSELIESSTKNKDITFQKLSNVSYIYFRDLDFSCKFDADTAEIIY